jgi:selenide,water dikinase
LLKTMNGPVRTEIVLIGGGHAHVHVLTSFAMRSQAGVRLTLVTSDLATPYSGMLPGVIAGLYAPDEAHIDLVRLAAATGTRLIHATANGLDRAAKRVLLSGRPPIAYDLVSIDVGISPALASIPGADAHAIAVKPIGAFLRKLGALLDRARAPDGPRRIAVVGGGAGGVELMLSLRSRLLADAATHGWTTSKLSFILVTDGEILSTHHPRVRTAFRRILTECKIELHEHRRVREIMACAIAFERGPSITTDAVLVATDAAAPTWFTGTGLAHDARGFLAVGPTLQTVNDPDVFAAGDCAALIENPREKAGVFAVRAGPPLAANLRRRASGRAVRTWRPQRQHLALISTGERYAVASRGAFMTEGAWVWTLKDIIDRRWMRMYQRTDRILASMAKRSITAPDASFADMRCGGCAAKIGPGPLSRALGRLSRGPDQGVVIGLDRADDAAVLLPPQGKLLVQTVDHLRAFITDPFAFGEIAANHALNDVFAMGAEPRHALATAVVPADASHVVEETLFQLLSGVRACLDRESVALVGGHSAEGADTALGLTVTGEVAPDGILRKSGLRSGDALILTRPLGTGILFAAAMRARADARWIKAALAHMRCSNRSAAAILIAHGASAMTDVSGFGLVGHLCEMLTASAAEAELNLGALPLYAGTRALAEQGIASTLLPENVASARFLRATIDAATRAIVFDPQTSGGLLAGVPIERMAACLSALRAARHDGAACIGRVGGKGLASREVGVTLVEA